MGLQELCEKLLGKDVPIGTSIVLVDCDLYYESRRDEYIRIKGYRGAFKKSKDIKSKDSIGMDVRQVIFVRENPPLFYLKRVPVLTYDAGVVCECPPKNKK